MRIWKGDRLGERGREDGGGWDEGIGRVIGERESV